MTLRTAGLSAVLPDPFQPILSSPSAGGIPLDRNGTERMLVRRSEILAATRRLISQVGYGQVTLRQISDECEVTVQTIYNSFGPRLDLLMKALNEHTTAIETAAFDIAPGPLLFLNVAEMYCQCAVDTPEFLREMVMMLFSTNDSLIQMQLHGTRHKTQLLRDMGRKPIFRESIQAHMLAAQITRVNAYAVFEWSLHQNAVTLRQEITMGNRLLMLGALQPWAATEVEAYSGASLPN